MAIPKLPKTTNTALKHDAAGVLGLSGPNAFYLTLQKKRGPRQEVHRDRQGHRRRSTSCRSSRRATPIRSIRITRVGQAARDFKTDDEAFKKLMEGKK